MLSRIKAFDGKCVVAAGVETQGWIGGGKPRDQNVRRWAVVHHFGACQTIKTILEHVGYNIAFRLAFFLVDVGHLVTKLVL